jgi:hypothetical protein
VPDAVEAALRDDLDVPPPARLLEFMGAGPNPWTAAEAEAAVRADGGFLDDDPREDALLDAPEADPGAIDNRPEGERPT